MGETKERVERCVAAVRERWAGEARVGIILGTGLGGLSQEIETEVTVPYSDIPAMPEPTLETHEGRLVLGRLAGVPVAVMDGRVHLYEGFDPLDVTLPVRVLRGLGAEVFVVSNVAGGLNRYFEIGDVVAIEDQINLMGVNPLIGPNDDELGPRFPDMVEPYDHRLIALAEDVARSHGIRLHRGVYAAMTGPSLETRAEYRLLQIVGADLIGMSTVPEVIVAVHAGLRTLGLSVVTDRCLPDALEPVNIEAIIRAGQEAEPKLKTIVMGVLDRL
ncbi:MAG: purine-nucleoside phosphorylase [Planctomycetota bacterium]